MEKKNYIWITGASSGIGKSITKKFIDENKYVVGTSRSEEDLERLRAQFPSNNENFVSLVSDIKDTENFQMLLSKFQENENIDCLVNNAGITTFSLAQNDSIETIKNVIDTNLFGAISAIKAVLPKMIERKKGMIINILSVAAETIFTKSSVYAASKAGLRAYTNVLREELREHNIKVINILPGATRTPIWPNEALEKFAERMMSPDDIADLVHSIYTNQNTLVLEEITIRPQKGDLD